MATSKKWNRLIPISLGCLFSTQAVFAALTLPPVQHLRMGIGIDSKTLQTKRVCVELDLDQNPVISCRTGKDCAQDTTYEGEFGSVEVTSIEEVIERMKGEAKASLGIGLFSASAEARFAKSLKFNQDYLYILVKATATKAPESLNNRGLRLTDEGQRALAQGLVIFHRECGNEVVDGRLSGGKFMALVELQTQSSEEKSTLAAKLNAGYLGFGEMSGKIDKELQQKLSNTRQTVTMISSSINEPLPDLKTVVDFARNFLHNVAIRNEPKVIEYYSRPYEDVISMQVDGRVIVDQDAPEFWERMAKFHIRAQSLQNLLLDEYDDASATRRREIDQDFDRVKAILKAIRTAVNHCLETQGHDCDFDHRDFIFPENRQQKEIFRKKQEQELKDREEEEKRSWNILTAKAKEAYIAKLSQRITGSTMDTSTAKALVSKYFNEDNPISAQSKKDLIRDLVRSREGKIQFVRFISDHFFFRRLDGDKSWQEMCQTGSVFEWQNRVHQVMVSREFRNHHPSTNDYVNYCYRNLCNRIEPDDSYHFKNWCRVHDDVGRIDMTWRFMGSPEIPYKFTERVIQTYLDRPTNDREVNEWTPSFIKFRMDDALIELLSSLYPDFKIPNRF